MMAMDRMGRRMVMRLVGLRVMARMERVIELMTLRMGRMVWLMGRIVWLMERMMAWMMARMERMGRMVWLMGRMMERMERMMAWMTPVDYQRVPFASPYHFVGASNIFVFRYHNV